MQGPIWGFVVGVPNCGWGDFSTFLILCNGWKLSQYYKGYSNILVIILGPINFFQRYLMFSRPRDKLVAPWLMLVYLTLVGVSCSLSRKEDPFFNVAGIFLIFWSFFRSFKFLSKTFNASQLQRPNCGFLADSRVCH